MQKIEKASVELISHACILIKVGTLQILCDPWFVGRAFNNGWGLSPKPDLAEVALNDITHIWISHEHPDHLSFPTLKMLSEKLDLDRTTVLFQETNSDKVFDALGKLGYRRFQPMRHLEPIELDDHTTVFVYGHRHLDSALGVIVDGDSWLLNINDTELTQHDCDIIRKAHQHFPIIFNQFSIAGFEGVLDEAKLMKQRSTILEKMIAHHRFLGASFSVPFASFMYFCRSDNSELNRFRSTVFDVEAAFKAEDLAAIVMKPGGPALEWDLSRKEPANRETVQESAEEFFRDFYANESTDIDEDDPTVELGKLSEAFGKRVGRWKKETFGFLFRKLGAVTCFIRDQNKGVSLDFAGEKIVESREITEDNADLLINSQPLFFAFSTPFGVQSLGVSGRYRFRQSIPENWKLVRIVSSLANSDLYIGTSTLLRASTYRWLWQRRRGLRSQVYQQFKRFFG